jgi:hypothetical protein
MKMFFYVLMAGLFFRSVPDARAVGPDFHRIQAELGATATVRESMQVRERYLHQMRGLSDFDRLTELEALRPGEDYFDEYRFAVSEFVQDHVRRFMRDRHSPEEQAVFASRIIGKGFGEDAKASLFETGLFYVQGCAEFRTYARQAGADQDLYGPFQGEYCSGGGSSGGGNGGGGHGGWGAPFELVSNVILEEGEYKVLYLPGLLYVKKLYISVEGIARSAYFDVMVNGDIKGTIHAPGSDPLYIVNVAATTRTIQLRSMYGNARIRSIKVEYR